MMTDVACVAVLMAVQFRVRVRLTCARVYMIQRRAMSATEAVSIAVLTAVQVRVRVRLTCARVCICDTAPLKLRLYGAIQICLLLLLLYYYYYYSDVRCRQRRLSASLC